MGKLRFLIVDDELDLCTGLKRTLAKEFPTIEIAIATSGDDALAQISENGADLALLDIQMPGMSGLTLLHELSSRDPWLTAIMMTGFGTIATAVEAIKLGAYDFITKPFDRELLRRTISKAIERTRLIRENYSLKQQVCGKEADTEFIGESQAMLRFQSQLLTIARSDYTTLVRGESGTGKELTARAIHSHSKRSDMPLVMVNCPAIPEHLLESELFGYVKGAFTGATHDQQGLLAEADGGTICFDEVGDLPFSIQAKLLRFLQEQEIKPLGGARTRQVDVRVIALTNLDLEKMIAERQFREDLFYRLNVVSLNTPSLQELADDIPLIVAHFTRKVCDDLDIDLKRFDQHALTTLCHRKWPGNVRELQNIVRRAVMFSPANTITVNDLQLGQTPVPQVPISLSSPIFHADELIPYKEAKQRILDNFTAEYVEALLKKTDGNISRAADYSGISRVALQKIIKRNEINVDQFRQQ